MALRVISIRRTRAGYFTIPLWRDGADSCQPSNDLGGAFCDYQISGLTVRGRTSALVFRLPLPGQLQQQSSSNLTKVSDSSGNFRSSAKRPVNDPVGAKQTSALSCGIDCLACQDSRHHGFCGEARRRPAPMALGSAGPPLVVAARSRRPTESRLPVSHSARRRASKGASRS